MSSFCLRVGRSGRRDAGTGDASVVSPGRPCFVGVRLALVVGPFRVGGGDDVVGAAGAATLFEGAVEDEPAEDVAGLGGRCLQELGEFGYW